ncbi:MAG: MarR family winged helix-turn-helix transcriptional regulator [Actinomycetes bacterium]
MTPVPLPDPTGADQSRRQDLVDRFVALTPTLVKRFSAAGPGGLPTDLASLTLRQLEVVRLLSSQPSTMRALAAGLGASESATSELVDRLVRRGLLERTADPDDRRVVRVRLAPPARLLADRFHAHRQQRARQVLSVLSEPELACFVDIVETIARDLPVPPAPRSPSS